MKKEWEKQEAALAKRRNGRRTKGSGNGIQPNDVHEAEIMWEAKQTDAASYILKLLTWRELRRNATLAGKMPAMAIRIQGVDLVVLSQDDFDERFPHAPL